MSTNKVIFDYSSILSSLFSLKVGNALSRNVALLVKQPAVQALVFYADMQPPLTYL